jgi:hypothetical protein
MTNQVIAVGAAANDGTGDSLRAALMKANANFLELYTGFLVGTTDPTATTDASKGVIVNSRYVNTTSKTAFICLDSTTGAAVWQRVTADVQIFTASGTWTKPAWCTTVEGVLIGGGAGGASGRRGAAGSIRTGGAGGGSGARIPFCHPTGCGHGRNYGCWRRERHDR